MKELRTINRDSFIISDEEAKNIEKVAEDARFILLRSGDFINVASISCILNYEDDYLNKYLN
jgi:hypothetical protein